MMNYDESTLKKLEKELETLRECFRWGRTLMMAGKDEEASMYFAALVCGVEEVIEGFDAMEDNYELDDECWD